MTNRADCYTGCGLVALAVLGYMGASRFPEPSAGLGAGGFPQFVTICLGVLGAIQAVKSYMALRKNPDQDKAVLKAADLFGAGSLLISFGVYVWLVQPLGYIISTTLFFFLFMLIYGERKWFRMVIISVVFSIVTYYLFVKVFYVMLPKGRIF